MSLLLALPGMKPPAAGGGGGELHPDPTCDNASAWTGNAITSGEVTVTGGEVVATGMLDDFRFQNVMDATYAIPVTAGLTQTMTFTISEITAGGNMQIAYRYYTDAAGTNQVGSRSGDIAAISVGEFTTTDTADATAAYMRLDLVNKSGGTMTFKVSDVSVTEA